MASSTITFQVNWSPEHQQILEALHRGDDVHPATVLYTTTTGQDVTKVTVGDWLKVRDQIVTHLDGLTDAKRPDAR